MRAWLRDCGECKDSRAYLSMTHVEADLLIQELAPRFKGKMLSRVFLMLTQTMANRHNGVIVEKKAVAK